MNAPFPLTPTLSLREKENKFSRNWLFDARRLAPARQTTFPLPEGEGQGEGEGDAQEAVALETVGGLGF
jgi:hypothetical protein